jgi:hypothetical protein
MGESGNPFQCREIPDRRRDNSNAGSVLLTERNRGEAQRDAAKKEAEAESARGAARASEERQKANQ